MLTLKELMKALEQVAIDREDLLDRPITGDFHDSANCYYHVGIVDVVVSAHDHKVSLQFVED